MTVQSPFTERVRSTGSTVQSTHPLGGALNGDRSRVEGNKAAIRTLGSADQALFPVERVRGARCAACPNPVAAPPRGPLPRLCPSCRRAHRELLQLRAYLRAAHRLAAQLGMARVAAVAAEAVAAFDQEEARR